MGSPGSTFGSQVYVEAQLPDGRIGHFQRHDLPPKAHVVKKLHIFKDHVFIHVSAPKGAPDCAWCHQSLRGLLGSQHTYVCRGTVQLESALLSTVVPCSILSLAAPPPPGCKIFVHKKCHHRLKHSCARPQLPHLRNMAPFGREPSSVQNGVAMI